MSRPHLALPDVPRGHLARRLRHGGLLAVCVVLAGCQAMQTRNLALTDPAIVTEARLAGDPALEGQILDEHGNMVPGAEGVANELLPPTELNKVSLPPYRLEPPDVLIINGLRTTPKSPYFIQVSDFLNVSVTPPDPNNPLPSYLQVQADGTIDLGPTFGIVKVEGKTTREAADTIRQQLQARTGQDLRAAVALLQQSAEQQIAGEHLVSQDGTISLGKFGSVYVTRMTLEEAKGAIEAQLSKYLENPEVSLDVFAYNSKVYYIIVEGAGRVGPSVVRIPITGNETVLDAISNVSLGPWVSKKMWISRPAPHGAQCHQHLPIDWDAITHGGVTSTNYQLLPGDRLFVAEDRMVAFSSFIGKVKEPFESMLGFTLLGAQTVQTIQRFPGENFGQQNF